MAQYRLIDVKKTNFFLDTESMSENFTLTYEKKAWYYFGKIKIVESKVDCPDHQVTSWLKSIREKIKKGQWRKG